MARAEPPRDESARGEPLRDGLKHNPFARLRPKTEADATSPTPPPEPQPRPTKSAPASKPTPTATSTQHHPIPAAERIVVRRERKGHGGKAVTIAEGNGLKGHDVEQLARDAAKALGAGARVEGGALVVQGEQTERLIAWLTSRGFKSLSRGN
jgi:translation initiation factor 1 (eIF-1/SUI1)